MGEPNLESLMKLGHNRGPYDGECEKADDHIIHVGCRDNARVGAKLGEPFV